MKIRPKISLLLMNPGLIRRLAIFRPRRFIANLYLSSFVFPSIFPQGLPLKVASSCGRNLKMILRVGDKSNPQETYYWLGFHEPYIQRLFVKFVKPGFIIYDIGAYIGFFSLLAGRLAGPSGRVYVFEPLPDNIERIKLHIPLNGMEDKVFCIPKAVLDKTGNAPYYDFGRNDWGHIGEAISSAERYPLLPKAIVETISLDEFVFHEGNPAPSLIKIDVEGCEGKVLAGARQLLEKFKPIIICEVHCPEAAKQVYEELYSLGYEFKDRREKKLDSVSSYCGHIIALPMANNSQIGMNLKVLYPIIDGEITGGNIVALRVIEEVLKRGGEAVVNSPTEGKITDILRRKGIKVYNIDTCRSFRFDSAIKLARIIKKEGINLVHSHAPLGGTVLSCLGGWLAGVPVITHAHVEYAVNRNPITRYCQLLLNGITSRFFCAKIIAVSESVKRRVIEQHAAAHKVTVVYNGINLDNSIPKKGLDEIRNEFSLKSNQRIIGEVARLSGAKGQHVLIKAAQKVIKENPDTVFMIVGEDFEKGAGNKKKLEALAQDLGIRQQIIFTGYRSDIMDLMNIFSIVALPFLIEGLPLVILEAMAAKKPVITTSAGGNIEAVIDGQTGTIIPPEDSARLAEAVIYHLRHPEISKNMGEAGYARVKQYFSLSEMLDKIMNIYKKVVMDR